MRLGICCVYFYGPDSEWLLDLHLQYLRYTLRGYDYTVYASANRLQPELRERLAREDRLEIVPLPIYDGAGAAEHAFYMDLLLQHALKAGCTHMATLDSDSFPILPGWPDSLVHQMRGLRVAAVSRSENRDTHLPHPCGCFMERSFLIDLKPRMRPKEHEMSDFLKATGQRSDTGIGFGYSLWKAKEPWLKLERTNCANPRSLMAGIYGGMFFHLGASSRRLTYWIDYQRLPSLRLGALLKKLPLGERVATFLENRYEASNRRAFDRIVSALKLDQRSYMDHLATGARFIPPKSPYSMPTLDAAPSEG